MHDEQVGNSITTTLNKSLTQFCPKTGSEIPACWQTLVLQYLHTQTQCGGVTLCVLR